MRFKRLISIPIPPFCARSWDPKAVNAGAGQTRTRAEITFGNDGPMVLVSSNSLQFSKEGVTAASQKNSRPYAGLARCNRNYFQMDNHQNAETRCSETQHFGGVKRSCNEAANITIKAYSQILNEERDPGLVSKIETTNETVSLNSHSGLQC